MKIQDALQDAMKDGMSLYAHSLMWVVQNGIHRMTDDVDSVDFNKVNRAEVQTMVRQNLLGIQLIQLYSMPLENKVFMFVLAENESDAKGLYLKRMNRLPTRIDDVSNNLDIEIWSEENGYRWLRDIKDETIEFPCHITDYRKE